MIALSRPGLDRGRERSAREVIDEHLLRWRNRDVEGDLARNYDPDVLILTTCAAFVGWRGARVFEQELRDGCAVGRLVVDAVQTGPHVGTAAWRLLSDDGAVLKRGLDGFLVRHGRIISQTRELTP